MSSANAGSSPVTTTETVVYTSPPVSSSYAGCNFLVEFGFYISPGVATTGINLKIRRTNITGTTVYGGNLMPVTASQNTLPFIFAIVDSPGGEVAGLLWVATVTQTAATGNGSVTQPWSRISVF